MQSLSDQFFACATFPCDEDGGVRRRKRLDQGLHASRGLTLANDRCRCECLHAGIPVAFSFCN